MSSALLHFPSKEAIISYLDQHPLTSKEISPYLKDKKIIDAVADIFANKDKVQWGVGANVMLAINDLSMKLSMPKSALIMTKINLTKALEDCALGKKIELNKPQLTSNL